MGAGLMNGFISKLESLLSGSGISPEEVLKHVSLLHDASVLSADNTDMAEVLRSLALRLKGKKTGIFPASSFLETFIGFTGCDNVTVYDDYRAGEEVAGVQIKHPREMSADELNHVVFLSFRPNLLEILQEKTDTDIITLQEALHDYVKNRLPVERFFNSGGGLYSKADALLAEIRRADNPVIFINGFLFNNYGPTFRALEERGHDVFIIAANEHLLYAKQDSKIYEFPLKNVHKLSVPEILYFAAGLDKGKVFLNDISFLLPGFNAYNGLVSLSFTTALLQHIRVKTVLFLYDIVPSFIEGYGYQEHFTKVYQAMLESADAVILNSNTKDGSAALRNMFAVDKPFLSFYRYNAYVPKLQEKLKDGFHLAIIGGMDDKLRDSRHMLIKLLRLGIYVHNYVPCKAMLEFEQQLTPEERKYYTLHESIVDQGELIYEISRYHAGWIVDNGYEVLNLINSVSNPKLKEVFMMFRLTTISSSLIVHAVAGLPVFLNRMVVHVTYEFPSDFFIPIEEAEVDNMHKIISETDWEQRYRTADEKRHLFAIDSRIDELINFLKEL